MPVAGNHHNRNIEQVLKESELEFKRKGSFSLIFPSNQSLMTIYKNLFQEQGAFGESINQLLYRRFVDRGIFI